MSENEHKAVDDAFETTKAAVSKAKACALELSSIAKTPWSGAIVHALERVEFELRYFRIVEDKRREDEEARKKEGL